MSGQNCETEPSQQIDSDIRSEATEGSDIKMKITDLTIICLEEIFEYLDLENLLNVADSNKRLNIAACFVFRRKHGKKRVYFSNSNYACLRINDGEIFVSKATDHLRFLRCFGCVTSNLMVFTPESSQKQMDKIFFYINEYCAESLIKLDIERYKINSITFGNNLQRPFLNIEMVYFVGCNLGTNVIQFNKWFPKMQHLTLFETDMVGKECIEMNFPNLRHLTYYPIDDNEILKPFFKNIIRLNPNLQSLQIYDWSVKILQNISNYFPQLEELNIRDMIRHAELNYVSDRVNFKSLKKLNIRISSSDSSKQLLKFNYLFDQLEDFHGEGIKFNDLLTFVKKYSTIKKLKLRSIYGTNDMNTENALQVAKSLPFLSELHLSINETFSVDEIIHYVDELKQVKKFHFKLDDQTVDDLRARLGNKWKVSVYLERRTWKRFIILQCCH